MPVNRIELGPVDSADALRLAVEHVANSHPNSLLLFRGQNNPYPTVRSGLARPDVRFEPEVQRGLSAVAGEILGHDSLSAGNLPFRMAVLQHYGYKTHYVDLTSDPNIAAWFASNKYVPRSIIYGGSPIRKIEQIRYVKREAGEGFVLVLAFPDAKKLTAERSLFDVSPVEPFVRPSRQKAWLLYDRQPLLPDPNEFWVATIKIDCSRVALQFSSEQLFPVPADDVGYRALLGTPFVEIPAFWLENHQNAEPKPSELPRLNWGIRALPVPEYAHSKEKDDYNHKWNDETLTESKPMQEWVKWQFELGDEIPGIRGSIREAKKITVSPRALRILYGAHEDTPLRWPDIGSNELFFTFAQMGYDKVDEINYPYEGVWLHRERDLVVEHPMSSTEDKLGVHSGHVFEFLGQALLRRNLPTSCRCESPNSHEARVRAMLRISVLVEAEAVVLLPHPLGIPDWYFVL